MIAPLIRELGQQRRILYWKNISANQECLPFSMLKGTPVSVQFHGMFNDAKVVIEGTNDVSDNQHFVPLTDSSGMTMIASTECMESVQQQCMAIRPRIIGGNDRTKINVYVFVVM